jgi:hypothetical protein
MCIHLNNLLKGGLLKKEPPFFDRADNTVSISLVKVAPRIEASFPELNGSPLTVITQTSKSIKAF